MSEAIAARDDEGRGDEGGSGGNGPTRSRSRGATRDATRNVRDVRGRRVRVDLRIERAERRAGSGEGERDLARGAREGSGRGDRSTRDAPGGGPSRRSAARPWTRRISRAARRSRRAVARNARGGGKGEGGEGTATVRHRRGGLDEACSGRGHVSDLERRGSARTTSRTSRGFAASSFFASVFLSSLSFISTSAPIAARGDGRRKRAEVWRAIARENETNKPPSPPSASKF